MQTIGIQAIPNQSFSVRLDNQLYDFSIKSTSGVMSVTIARNGETILSNSRCVAGVPLIPYQYLENGNFIILTSNGDYPDYTQFGITQTLVYASEEELETIRAGN